MVVNKYIGETVNIDVQFKNTGYTQNWFQITGQVIQGTKTAQTQVEALVNPGETVIINPAVQIPSSFTEETSCDVTAILRDKASLTELDREPNPGAVYIKKLLGGQIISKTVS